MTIGEVARRAGLRASAIRYYERIGLLERAERTSGHRVYGDGVLDRLAVIAFARASGFTLREIRRLFGGRPWSASLRRQAGAKLDELDAAIARARAMKTLLERALRCRCADLDQCGRLMRAARDRDARSSSAIG
jgi:DNA-binding transcriptional MerR regulator